MGIIRFFAILLSSLCVIVCSAFAQIQTIEIATAEDLYSFAELVSNGTSEINAVLTADIVLNENVLDENGELRGDVENLKQWTPIGTEEHPFEGTFDGQGFAIYGLYINPTNQKNNVGLIGFSNAGIIKNVGIEEGYIKGYANVGGVCGSCRMGTISHCYNLARIEGESSVGGICGYSDLTIYYCYNLGTVLSDDGVLCGGICGCGEVSNCYNVGYCNGEIFATKSWNSNSYFDKDIYGGNLGRIYTDPELMITTSTYGISLSDFVSETLPEHLSSDVWVAGTPTYGEIITVDNEFAIQEIGALPSIKGMNHTHSKIAKLYNFGDSNNPLWLEYTPVYSSDDIVSMSANYVVMQNYETTNAMGTLSNPFVGNFSGNRHTITLISTETTDEQALFLYSQGTIMRLNTVVSFSACNNAAGICVHNEGTIKSCHVSGTIIPKYNAGGICLQNNGTIYDCVNSSTITSKESKGQSGICCINNGTITSCINEGVVDGMTAAGICARNIGVVSNCINNANLVSGMGSAGIVYENYGTVTTSCTYIDAESSATSGASEEQTIVTFNANDNCVVENCYVATKNSTTSFSLLIHDFCNGNLPEGLSETYWKTLPAMFSDYTRYKYYPVLQSELCSTMPIVAQKDPYYNLTLNGNGGCFEDIKIYVRGEKCVLPSNVTRSGFTFGGWYDNSNFIGNAYTEIPITATGDKSFYARWTTNYYSVNLFSNGGRINSGNITGYYYGAYIQLPTDVTKTGYTFKGWKSVPNTQFGISSLKEGATDGFVKMVQRYTSLSAASILTSLENLPQTVFFSVPNVYIPLIKEEIANYTDDDVRYMSSSGLSFFQFGDVVLTEVGNDENKLASLIRSYFAISLDDAFTLIANAPITIATDINNTVIDSFNKEISEFGASATIANGYRQIYVTAITPTDREDKYLQADWQRQTYDVVLHTSGATILDEPITQYSYGNVTYLPKQLELKGYTFKGWYSNSYFDGLPVEYIDSVEYGNKQFWARWVVNCDVQVSGTMTPASCFGFSDGKIELAVSEATEPLSFQWVGMENNTAIIENISAGNYQVVVTDDRGCSATKTFTVSQPNEIQVTVSEVINPKCNEQSAIKLTANGDYTYLWNNGSTEKDLIGAEIGDYEVTVTEPTNGCSIKLSQSLELSIKQPEIALVTVSKKTGKNLVVWVRENTDLIKYYTIYRESDIAGSYEKIATVPYSEISVYEDENVDPMVRSWSYKISATDYCGNETALSDYHATIRLNQPKSLREGYADLSWDPYIGLEYSSYYIIRETKVQDYTFIDTVSTVPSSIKSYSAEIPTVGKSTFYVGIKLNTIINPKDFLKAESGPFAIALSNIAEAENTEMFIHTIDQSNVEVYAVNHTIYVKNAAEKNIAIFDNSGRCLYRTFALQSNAENEYSVRLNGVYFVTVENESFSVIVR